MINRVSLGVVSLLATATVALAESGYMQKLRDLSFDMSLMREYPVAWTTSGSAVPILSKVKIVPNIPKVNGQIFLKQELATAGWDVTYRLTLNQTP